MKIGPDISSQLPAANEGQKQAKLVDAAQQFEATMLQELLKPIQHGQDSWDGEEKSEDSASDTISSFGTEAIANAISKGGGFGIAKQIVSKLSLQHSRYAERKSSSTKVSRSCADTFK